jgi:hypothetical protein
MKSRSILQMASLVLMLPILGRCQVGSGYTGVPVGFGAHTFDTGFVYGFQYQSLPRHAGPYSDTYTLPGSVVYSILGNWIVHLDATTLKSVEYPSASRATGFGDMALGTSKAFIKETSWPSVSASYQLSIPTGDASLKLGTGSTSHQFSLGFGKTVLDSWKLSATAGDLLKQTGTPLAYVNAPFFAASATYGFIPKALSASAPLVKFEVDYIPHYSTVPSEVYTVNTFVYPLHSIPLQLSFTGRAGLTPYSPSWVVAFQTEYEINVGPRCHHC